MTPEEFKSARKKLHFTQKEMAKALGLESNRAIRYYETGERAISRTIEILIKTLLDEHNQPTLRRNPLYFNPELYEKEAERSRVALEKAATDMGASFVYGDYVDEKTASKLLVISRWLLKKYTRGIGVHRLPFLKIGRKRFYSLKEISYWLARGDVYAARGPLSYKLQQKFQ